MTTRPTSTMKNGKLSVGCKITARFADTCSHARGVEPAWDDVLVTMRAVTQPAEELLWLSDRPQEEAITGYDAQGWQASTWVLHAMYENRSLPTNVTHHAWHHSRILAGLDQPTIVNGVNLDETTITTGGQLGYVARPDAAWQRLRWRDHADRIGQPMNADQPTPPCYRWFPTGSWPLRIAPPPEGSLDETSLIALLAILAEHSDQLNDTPCFAYYGSLASGDFDRPTLLAGPLSAVDQLVAGDATFVSTPSNLWPDDRSWFVWTDWDLWATKSADRVHSSTPCRTTLTWRPSRGPSGPNVRLTCTIKMAIAHWPT